MRSWPCSRLRLRRHVQHGCARRVAIVVAKQQLAARAPAAAAAAIRAEVLSMIMNLTSSRMPSSHELRLDYNQARARVA